MRDPTGSLVELLNRDGVHHLAIYFDEAYHNHHCLTGSVQLVESFLQFPMVVGLAELSRWDKRQGAFLYPTGQVWTLAEILRTAREKRAPLGVRAGVELCVLAGQILTEAHDVGRCQGCYAHGNVSPWRIALKSDGQLLVIGQGLPQMDWRLHLEDSTHPALVEAVRYAPPERIEGQPEDLSADIYALTVVAYEVMTGEALFPEQRLPDLRKAITMGDALTRVEQSGKRIPKEVRSVLASALAYDPDARINGHAFVEALRVLLNEAQLEGESLETWIPELIQQSQSGRRRARKLVATQEVTTARPRPTEETPEKQAIAKPVVTTQRSRKRGDSKSDTTVFEINAKPARKKTVDAPATKDRPKLKSSRRKRRKDVEAELAAEVAAKGVVPAMQAEDGAPLDVTVARRRKPSVTASPEAPAAAPAKRSSKRVPKANVKSKTAAKPRQRRRGVDKPAPEADATAQAPAEVAQEPTRSKRQRRRKSSAAKESASPTAVASPSAGETGIEAAAPAPEAVLPVVDDAPAEDSTTARRRRRRKSPEDTPIEAAEASDTTTARRRRRKAATADDEVPADDTTTARRRRRKAATADDEVPADDTTTARRRRRRDSKDEAPADDSTTARRRRRKRSED
jgi:hypothetical protein